MTNLFACLLVLPEEMIKDGTVLFMDSLHLIDVLGHFLHADQSLHKVLRKERVKKRVELAELSLTVKIEIRICIPLRLHETIERTIKRNNISQVIFCF